MVVPAALKIIRLKPTRKVSLGGVYGILGGFMKFGGWGLWDFREIWGGFMGF